MYYQFLKFLNVPLTIAFHKLPSQKQKRFPSQTKKHKWEEKQSNERHLYSTILRFSQRVPQPCLLMRRIQRLLRFVRSFNSSYAYSSVWQKSIHVLSCKRRVHRLSFRFSSFFESIYTLAEKFAAYYVVNNIANFCFSIFSILNTEWFKWNINGNLDILRY